MMLFLYAHALLSMSQLVYGYGLLIQFVEGLFQILQILFPNVTVELHCIEMVLLLLINKSCQSKDMLSIAKHNNKVNICFNKYLSEILFKVPQLLILCIQIAGIFH